MSLKHFLIALRNALAFKAVPFAFGVHFVGRGRMFLDPGDSRGRRVREWVGSTRYRNTWLWRAAVRSMQPDLALDIGANYGEIAFSARYPEGCRVVLVEANSKLAALLERSARTRTRSADKWRIVHAAASDRQGMAEFFISEASSGTSRLTPGGPACAAQRIEKVQLVRIDDLPEAKNPQRLVFKIDVEGAEVAALQGMQRCLESATQYLGLVELSEANLVAAGFSSQHLWDLARRYGRVALFNEDDQLIECSQLSWDQMVADHRRLRLRFNYATDLVMFKSVAAIEALAPARSRRKMEHLVKKLVPRLSIR